MEHILSRIRSYCTKTNLAITGILLFLLLYPDNLRVDNIYIVNQFIKTRVLSLAIVFLILRLLTDDYYSPKLAIIFLFTLLLAPTIPFGYLVLIILVIFIVLKLWKKI